MDDDKIKYLFNSKGDWIAFVVDWYVYDSDGMWIGWLPWQDDQVVDIKGRYLGTIYGDRLYERILKPKRVYRTSARYIGNYGKIPYPDYVGRVRVPLFFKDVKGLKGKPF